MADYPSPPSIAVSESKEGTSHGERDGEVGVKQSLESLLSRSDSASADETEEADHTSLSVPGGGGLQERQRETSRKGHKISVNDALALRVSCGYGYDKLQERGVCARVRV